ncbi:MAG TPA: hypothetical protein VET89_12430 [Stellaceae bacterium]|nr:hypothetical protein [Stellaceae bacterium]
MIRILAVVLPAVGTAAAAMAALYPRDEVARTNVIIGSLGQLHGQIAVEVWGLQCDSTPSDDPKSPWKKNAEVIEKWMARKEQILNPARSNPAGSGATEAKSLPTGASQQPAAPK